MGTVYAIQGTSKILLATVSNATQNVLIVLVLLKVIA